MDVTQVNFTYKDILLRKLSYSVTCSVLSQLVILNFYIFLNNHNVLHPLDWILGTFKIYATFSAYLFILPFTIIIFGQSIICAKDYVVKQTYCSTRFQRFFTAFSLHNILLLLLHIIVGAVLNLMYLNLGGGKYGSLTKSCDENIKNANCLNEGTFYLIFSGLFVGCYFFLKVYMSEKHLCFPVVPQRKFLQLKSNICRLVRSSIINSMWPSLFYIIFYNIYGSNLSESCARLFNIKNDTSSNGVGLYFYLFLFNSVYYFNMNLMRFFFNLFLTEPIEFPIIKINANTVTLQESINNNEWPIVQNLACLDLFLLSQWSKNRRQVFFSLSQPGGHPHNWNNLVENILKLFKEYTDLLNKSTTDIIPEQISSDPMQIFSPERFRNLRNMRLCSPECYSPVTVTTTTNFDKNIIENTHKIVIEKVHSAYNFLKIMLGINFLFGELPQTNVQKCLGNGNLIIWACQGISEITSAAMVEDKFGIVQKDLPIIVTTLVNLKQSLDKLNKIPALSRKIAGLNDFNYKMKAAVCSALKRSLFNICISYGPYLSDFPLNKDVFEYLQTYVTCKQ